MIGALIGDISGSRFEWNNIKTKEFELLTDECKASDDSHMSLAIAQALMDCHGDRSALGPQTVRRMQEMGRKYPHSGHGAMFGKWIISEHPEPYNSYGNGAAMRVSACAYAAKTLDEAKQLARAVTEVTHNHPEGLKGAEATTSAIYMALHGSRISEIRSYINDNYYPMDFTLDSIRDTYTSDLSCQGSVPQAITAFLESTGFEDTIRNAISIGGDSDTIAAIAGSIAEAYYGVPSELRDRALTYLDDDLKEILTAFETRYGYKAV